jgi:hypothetical protein
MKTISKEAYSRIYRMVNDTWRESFDEEFGKMEDLVDEVNFSTERYKDLRNAWDSKSNKRLLDKLFIGHKKMADNIIDRISSGENVHVTGWWAKDDPTKQYIVMNKPIHFHGDKHVINMDEYSIGYVGVVDPTVADARVELIKLLDEGLITFNNPSPIRFE